MLMNKFCLHLQQREKSQVVVFNFNYSHKQNTIISTATGLEQRDLQQHYALPPANHLITCAILLILILLLHLHLIPHHQHTNARKHGHHTLLKLMLIDDRFLIPYTCQVQRDLETKKIKNKIAQNIRD